MSPETAAYPTDEQILDLPDSAESEIPSEPAETSESPAPIETQTEEVSREENLSPEQAKPGTATQPKQQTDKPSTTPEQEQETIAAKAAELDRSDEAFATGDVAGMAETFEQMFGENPAGLTDAMWMGYRFLEQRSPEQFAHFSKMIVADQLAQIGVKWEALEKLAAYLERAGDRETFEDLNKLAVMFKNVGMGPSTPESQGAAVKDYSSKIGGMMERSVPALIRSVLGERFSSVKPVDQQELLMAGKLAVKDFLARDPKVSEAFRKLGQKYSEKEGVRVYLEILAPRLKSVIPLVANNLANEYRDLFKAIPQPAKPAQPAKAAQPVEQAPRSWAEARARNMTMADVLKATEGEIASGSFLSQEEADSMSVEDVLNSRRVPLTRKPWQPGNELDGL